MSLTPRTDALVVGGCIAINIVEHARGLEIEADASRARVKEILNGLDSTQGALDQITSDCLALQTKIYHLKTFLK